MTDDQTFSYDQSGNVLSANVVSSGATIAADYDNNGRLWKVYQASYPAPTSPYAYDPSTGRLSSVVDPAGTTSYAYNANGLLSEITDPFSATHVIYSYDTAGRVTKRTDGSGLCWTQSYEAETGRADIRRIRQGGPTCTGTIHATFALGYDEASNVTSRAETITGNTAGRTPTATTGRTASPTSPAPPRSGPGLTATTAVETARPLRSARGTRSPRPTTPLESQPRVGVGNCDPAVAVSGMAHSLLQLIFERRGICIHDDAVELERTPVLQHLERLRERKAA